MNIQQTNLGHPGALPKPTGQKEPSTALQGRFEGQLSAVQSNMDWINPQTLITEEKRQLEDLEKEQKEKAFERRQVNAELALSMITRQKITAGQNQANLAESTALNMTHLKESGNQTSATRFNRSMEGLKGAAAEKVMAEKIMQKKGYLYNPALAQAKSESEATEHNLRQLGEKPKGDEAKALSPEPSFLSRSEESTSSASLNAKKSSVDMAQFAQLKNLEGQKQTIPLKVDAQTDLIQSVKAGNQAASTSDFKGVAKTLKAEGPSLQGSGLSGQVSAKSLSAAMGEAKEAKKPTPQPNMKEVAQNVKILLKEGQSEITMQLNPAHLGRLEIKLKKEGEKVSAELKVSNAEAQEAMNRQLPELKETLLNQGVKVDQFSIVLADEAGFGFAMNSQDGQQGQQQQATSGENAGFHPQVTEETQATRSPSPTWAGPGMHIYA